MPSESFRNQVLQRLQERGVYHYCELCKHNDWMILEQPLALIVTDPEGRMVVPSPPIPAVGLFCKNCGNVRLHALGALGLLPQPEEAARA